MLQTLTDTLQSIWKVPFEWRLSLLVGLMLMVVLGERLQIIPGRKRHLEYGFLLFCGACGSLLGLLVDQITYRISASYFVDGKGLSISSAQDPTLLRLGIEAGFVAGAVVAIILVLSLGQSRLQKRLLLSHLWPIIVSALGAALGLGLLQYWGSTFELGFLPTLGMEPQPRLLFETVWMTHLGLYLGALGITVVVAFRLFRCRQGEARTDLSER